MMSHEKFLVTVIVTVYNIEKYLEECVESLLNQTYKHTQIILVDDGSTDNSGKLCDEFAVHDSRIKVIHQKNSGSAFARKAGLDAATGDYVMFVDGDDWIDTETLEHCVAATTENHNVDCIIFSYVKEYPDNSIKMHLFDGDMKFSPEQAEHLVYRRLFGLSAEELKNPERMDNVVSCCMKLYRTETARKGQYFDVKAIGSSEDTLFNMYALHDCGVVIYIDKCFYHYRKLEGSITNSYRPNLSKQWATLFSIMRSIITEKELPEKYHQSLDNRIALSIVGVGLNEISNKNYNIFKRYCKIRDFIHTKDYRNSCKKIPTKYMPLVWKVFFICCKYRFSLAVFFMLLAMTYLKKH